MSPPLEAIFAQQGGLEVRITYKFSRATLTALCFQEID
jgi:hypothetical protein